LSESNLDVSDLVQSASVSLRLKGSDLLDCELN